MAERKELEITITPDGAVSVRVKCVKGQSCVDESKFLEDALGGAVQSRELTSEYYEPVVPVSGTVKTGR
jgi:hypothetical protein